MVSKKHSGSLLMAPPFYSKNATANKFSRLGAITMHAYMCAVWDEPKSQPNTFLAWWADAEARGLCYSFELVVPRALGDHGATPKAAYLVLTTVAQTKPGAVFDSDDYHHREQPQDANSFSSRFLSPAEVIALATRWRLPLNEAWYCPSGPVSAAVEDALHSARWTLKDSEVGPLIASAAQNATAVGGDGGSGGQTMITQGFLTHLETQGEVLEGFVLMALQVGSMEGLAALVARYNAEMAPHRARTLEALLTLGKRSELVTPVSSPSINLDVLVKSVP